MTRRPRSEDRRAPGSPAYGSPAAGGVAHGSQAHRPDAAQAEPGRRLRLHELRLARPRPGAPAHGRVLRERRQGGRRGGDHATGPRRSSSPGTASPSSTRTTSTGSASRAGSPSRWSSGPGGTHYEPIEWDEALRADRRPAAARSTVPTRRSSTRPGARRTRPRSSTSCSSARSAPTTCPTARTCATSRRSVALAESIGIGKGSVSLDDIYDAELHRHRRPEPGHQPPAHAVGAGDRQAARREDHRDQPAARGRAGQLPQPAEAPRRRRPGHRHRRPAPADPVNGDLALFQAIGSLLVRVGRRSTTSSSTRTRTGSTRGASTSRGVDWDEVERGDRAHPGADHRGGRDDRATPTPPSTAGRWASPSTATPWRRSRRSPTSRSPGATSASAAPACARCAATPTCRATARWASGNVRREHFLDALQAEFGFDPPREHGYDTVDSIRAMRDGKVHVFIGLGGNFVQAAPDTDVTASRDAQRRADRADLHQAQPLAPRLRRDRADPADPRPHREGRPGRRRAVRHGRGLACRPCTPPAVRWNRPARTCAPRSRSSPASPRPRSATATASTGRRCATTTASSATTSRASCPGCDDYEVKVDRPGGFVLPHPPRDSRDVPHHVAAGPSSPCRRSRCSRCPTATCCCRRCAATTSSTPRSTGSATATAASRAAAGWSSCTRDDIAAFGFGDGEHGRPRRATGPTTTSSACAHGFRIVAYDTPRGIGRGLLPRDQPAGAAGLDRRSAATPRRRSP